VNYECCCCLLLLFAPVQSFALSHVCSPMTVGILGGSRISRSHGQAAWEPRLSASKLPCQQGWDMTCEPELRAFDPNAFKLDGRLGSWATSRQRQEPCLNRLRQQHSKRRESLVLRVGCGTAPARHGVATMGVCSLYLPWEKAAECLLCADCYR